MEHSSQWESSGFLLSSHTDGRVSIRWGDPVGESGGGGRAEWAARSLRDFRGLTGATV
jgi:hypothetical protein